MYTESSTPKKIWREGRKVVVGFALFVHSFHVLVVLFFLNKHENMKTALSTPNVTLACQRQANYCNILSYSSCTLNLAPLIRFGGTGGRVFALFVHSSHILVILFFLFKKRGKMETAVSTSILTLQCTRKITRTLH